VKGGTPVPLRVSPDLRSPNILDLSSDRSRLLVAASLNGDEKSLWIVPAQGGFARQVGDVVINQAAAWSPDGRQIVFSHDSTLFLVNADGTGLRKIIDTPEAVAGDIRWAPGRDSHVLRLSLMPSGTWVGALWEVTSNGAGLHPLIPGWNSGAAHPDGDYNGSWIPSGKYFLFRSRRGPVSSVWAIRESSSWLPPSQRRPVQVYSGPLGFNPLTPSPDGKRIFFPAGQERRELVRYDLKRGEFLPYLSGVAGRWVEHSWDERWVAYTLTSGHTLWRCRPDGSERVQLLTGAWLVRKPSWSPDGKWIAFDASEPGKPFNKIYVIPVTPSGNAVPECVTPGPSAEIEPSWSPDGRMLLFRRDVNHGATGEPGLYTMDWSTREAKLLPGSSGVARSSWSPNPRYIAGTTFATSQIMLFDFRTRQWTQLAGGKTLGPPQWSRDGKYLYYQDLAIPRQPIFRVQISNREVDRITDSSLIPQSNVTGYALAGLAPGDEPIAAVVRSNSDLYALDMDLP
jgi:Tol biopolymer transport system component